MNKVVNIIDRLLDILKKTLVRFRNAKFGLLFFANIFKLPDFFTDKRVSIISKAKVVFVIVREGQARFCLNLSWNSPS